MDEVADRLSERLMVNSKCPGVAETWIKHNYPTTIIAQQVAGPNGLVICWAAIPAYASEVGASLLTHWSNELVTSYVARYSDLFGLGESPDQAFFDLVEKMRGFMRWDLENER